MTFLPRHFPTCLRVCVVALGLAVHSANADQKVWDEYAIKAAYVYNLGKFVAWPAAETEGDEAFEICIYGRDPYGEKIDVVSSRTINGRSISIRRFGSLATSSCSIAFIGQSETYKLEEALSFFADLPVLTVGEDSEFVDKGGMVALVADRSSVTFEINLQAARRAKLGFDSNLLRIASRTVR